MQQWLYTKFFEYNFNDMCIMYKNIVLKSYLF